MPIVLLFLFASLSQAATLVNRSQFLNTEILPDGLWTFGLSKGQSLGKGRESFASDGTKLSNTDYLSRDVSYGNLLDEVDDPVERELAAAAFDVYGIKANAGAGQARNRVSLSSRSDAYILGKGFGKKLSFFAVFPVVTMDMRFKSEFVLSDSLRTLAQKLEADGQYQKAREILEKSQRALSDRLSETGYRTEYPGTITTLANVFLTTRYKAYQNSRFTLSSDSSIVVPSGYRSGPRDLIYLRINEEQFSGRQSVTTNYRFTSRNDFLVSSYYHKRFPFEKARRVPRNGVSPVSPEIDNDTRTQYGDSYGVSAQVNHVFSDAILAYAGQSFEIRNRDQVSGKKYEQNRYDYLEKNSAQNLAIVYGGMALNSIQKFLSGKFLIPMDLNLQYSRTLAGRNAFVSEAVTMNLLVFYK